LKGIILTILAGVFFTALWFVAAYFEGKRLERKQREEDIKRFGRPLI
jgi:hypothetical protein